MEEGFPGVALQYSEVLKATECGTPGVESEERTNEGARWRWM